MSEMMHFFDSFWDENLARLKQHVEAKAKK